MVLRSQRLRTPGFMAAAMPLVDQQLQSLMQPLLPTTKIKIQPLQSDLRSHCFLTLHRKHRRRRLFRQQFRQRRMLSQRPRQGIQRRLRSRR